MAQSFHEARRVFGAFDSPHRSFNRLQYGNPNWTGPLSKSVSVPVNLSSVGHTPASTQPFSPDSTVSRSPPSSGAEIPSQRTNPSVILEGVQTLNLNSPSRTTENVDEELELDTVIDNDAVVYGPELPTSLSCASISSQGAHVTSLNRFAISDTESEEILNGGEATVTVPNVSDNVEVVPKEEGDDEASVKHETTSNADHDQPVPEVTESNSRQSLVNSLSTDVDNAGKSSSESPVTNTDESVLSNSSDTHASSTPTKSTSSQLSTSDATTTSHKDTSPERSPAPIHFTSPFRPQRYHDGVKNPIDKDPVSPRHGLPVTKSTGNQTLARRVAQPKRPYTNRPLGDMSFNLSNFLETRSFQTRTLQFSRESQSYRERGGKLS